MDPFLVEFPTQMYPSYFCISFRKAESQLVKRGYYAYKSIVYLYFSGKNGNNKNSVKAHFILTNDKKYIEIHLVNLFFMWKETWESLEIDRLPKEVQL